MKKKFTTFFVGGNFGEMDSFPIISQRGNFSIQKLWRNFGIFCCDIASKSKVCCRPPNYYSQFNLILDDEDILRSGTLHQQSFYFVDVSPATDPLFNDHLDSFMGSLMVSLFAVVTVAVLFSSCSSC